jgi:hypothetical protein
VFKTVKKNIYLFQTSIRYENTLYLPYTAGVLAAFAWDNEVVAQNYTLKGIVYLRENIEKTANALDSPYLAAFSNYIWNFEYNKALAKQIKSIYPECIVVFGGHNVPPGTALLDEYAAIDILVHGEGEEAFRDILLALHNGDPLSGISNISYRDSHGESVTTPAAPVICSDFPSPYKAGLFDSMLDEQPDIRFSAILETNRGCPYGCAFCDWCLLDTKVRQLSAERVNGDLEWMSRHKIEFCYCADANFGIMPRDEHYVDRLIELNRENGYPQKFRVNYAKHNNDTVFRINKKLNAYDISKGATISFQSLNQQVLENIGRKNMPLEKFSELMTLYGNAGIPTYSELILGLPGETYDSFCHGVNKLLEAGQHTSIMIYNCELIVNSLMANKNYMEKHGIQAASTPLYLRHDEPDCDEIHEYSKSITATATMSREDWILSNLFSITVQSCHGMGLLRCFAVYLYFEKGIQYQEFYRSFVTWAENNPDTATGKEMLFMRGEFEKITRSKGLWSYTNELFGSVSWPYEEGMYLDLVYRFESFYEDMRSFLSGYAIEKEVFENLFLYQKSIIKIPGVKMLDIGLEYDLPGYFAKAFVGAHEIMQKKTVAVSAADNRLPSEWKDYAKEYIWYGRKEQRNIFTELTVK